ncbi:predicted protein [Chaetoceros tenuissimus]|uniref:25S rRNA (uridine-N(3))-methyltransferase BMT5-like domain-containing protein n=1 Tax=Chaetoceros tenuissimus TaxID=426638 RepID=A0AAD3CDT7_9STRA|nr:predicted protein [Chaetoceros tenuissimus]
MNSCSRDETFDKISYDDFLSILLLGEADFSFTRALLRVIEEEETATYRFQRNVKITSSEYGDAQDVAQRYFDQNLEHLKDSIKSLYESASRNSVLLDLCFGLNARSLGKGLDNKNEQVCMCQRWNQQNQKFDAQLSPFWNESNEKKYDLIIFNFPHSDQAGRATKLVKALFRQLRICIEHGVLSKHVILEMRLRYIETNKELKKNIRSFYKHEEAAEEYGFEGIGCFESDLHIWERYGYQHKWTKKNGSCRDMIQNCNVWRFQPIDIENRICNT